MFFHVDKCAVFSIAREINDCTHLVWGGAFPLVMQFQDLSAGGQSYSR